MTTKRCAYRGCGSFTNPTHPSPETFFAFPKNIHRYKIWQKLGGCQEDLPNTMRYFCSKHFDESKYIAHNQRRKQLLGTAVPWPYDQFPNREILSDEVDYQCVVSTMDDNDDVEAIERFHEEERVSVEVSNDISNISDSIEDAFQSYEYHNVSDGASEFTISFNPEKKSLKRKMVETSGKQLSPDDLEPGPSSRICTSNRATSSTISVAKEDASKEPAKTIEEIDESKLIESANLTTFIYKGEEYVQMPKDDYVNEKMSLIQKIRTYEEILKHVKQLVEKI